MRGLFVGFIMILNFVTSSSIFGSSASAIATSLPQINCPAIAATLNRIVTRKGHESGLWTDVVKAMAYADSTRGAIDWKKASSAAIDGRTKLHRHFFFSDLETQAAIIRLFAVGIDSATGSAVPSFAMSELQMMTQEAVNRINSKIVKGPDGEDFDLGKSAYRVLRLLSTVIPAAKNAYRLYEEGQHVTLGSLGHDTDYSP